MGTKQKIVILIFAIFCFYVPTYSSSRRGGILQLGKACTDHLQGSMKHETVCGSGGIAVDPNKFGHASGGGGGRAVAASRSQPSEEHGSGAAIPYAAGAAAGGAANDNRNNHRNHSGSNRNHNGVEFVTLAFIILACLLLRQN